MEFKGDYLLGYGVNVANIFVFLSTIAVVREILLKRKRGEVFTLSRFKVVILCAIAFFLIAAGASIRYSPFLIASIVWLLQYMQLFIIAFLVLYLFSNHRKQFAFLYTTIFVSLLLQVFISFWQFLKQSSVGLPIEFSRTKSFFALGLDEVNTMFRVPGTFHYSNQLALIVLTLIIILSPFALRKKNVLYLAACIAGVVVIIMTQSRSIWIGTTIVGIVLLKTFEKEVNKIVEILGRTKFISYTALVTAGLSFVIIPRVILSFNAFYEGAGIPIRIKMIKEALTALQTNPWIGYGVGTNEYVLFSLFPSGVMAVFPAAVHAAFVQLALEVGILGLVLFLFPSTYIARVHFGKIGRTEMKTKTSRDYWFSFAIGSFIFFVYYLFQPHVGIVEFPYLGLLLGMGLISLYREK